MRMLLTLAELGRAAGGFEAVLLARPGDGVIPAPRGPRTYFICTCEVNSPGIKVLGTAQNAWTPQCGGRPIRPS